MYCKPNLLDSYEQSRRSASTSSQPLSSKPQTPAQPRKHRFASCALSPQHANAIQYPAKGQTRTTVAAVVGLRRRDLKWRDLDIVRNRDRTLSPHPCGVSRSHWPGLTRLTPTGPIFPSRKRLLLLTRDFASLALDRCAETLWQDGAACALKEEGLVSSLFHLLRGDQSWDGESGPCLDTTSQLTSLTFRCILMPG